MDNEHPVKVTVAIPVYNGAADIRDAIDSVLAQTFTDLELVVLDDASTDDTIEVVRSYDDPRIRLVSGEPNLGYIGNFNRAVAHARGEYIKILCHDDVIVPTCLAQQVAVLDADTAHRYVFCTARKKIVGPGRQTLMPPQGFRGPTRALTGSEAVRKCVRAGRNLIGETSVALARTEVMRAVGSFATKYTLDLNMWTRMLEHGDCFFIAEALSEFRVTPTSGTAAQRLTQAEQHNDFAQRLRNHDFGITSLDLRIGDARAHLNQALRGLVFRWAAIRHRS